MLVISDGLGALRFESISFPFTRTLWNDARSTGRRECGKAIYHDHSPAHYRFHFWHIIKGNRFITDKFRIYFHSTTTGKRLVLTFVIFFFPEGNKDRTSDSGCWGWAEAGFFTGCFVCLFVFFLCYFSACSVVVRGHRLWYTCQRTACGSGFLLTRAASSGQSSGRWFWWQVPFFSQPSCQPMFTHMVPRNNE